MTIWPRVGFTLCTLAALGLFAPAAAQPAPRPGARPPAATPPPPPPEPDPETRAKLDEQAASVAEATRKLAEQQQVIDGLSAALAEAKRQQDDLATAQRTLGDALAAERKARLDAEAAAHAAPQAPTVRSSWPQLSLSGLVQIDATVRQSSEDEVRQSGDPLNQDRFFLRRGRLRATAVYGQLSGLAEIDLNTVSGSQVRVSAAEVAYQLAPWLGAAVGLIKIPFGFEVVQSDKDRLFLERSTVVRALFPGEYDVGARLAGGWRFLRYAVAAQNGEPAGEKGFALRDPNQAKDITARAGVVAPVGPVEVAAGVSLLTGRGFHAGTPATKDTLVWKDLNEDGVVTANEITVVQGLAATPSSNFDRFGVGGDLELTIDLARLGKLTAYGEVMVAGNLDRAIVVADPTDITGAGRDFRELGYHAGLVYEPGAASAFGVRYDRYNPDADASELRVGNVVPVDQTLSTLSVAAALRGSHGRLILEYDHNTNHSGRTAAGVPTNLGDDAVTLRAEIQL
ncbi:MAG TPA: hypothetical protein VHW23_06335 [Kofleriaceae bacterium]|nr:hypothetical protein [Kofleriaceae bacterium]